jgi:hypothetical protein
MIEEETTVHTRLLRFTLGVAESRAYWRNNDPSLRPADAFTGYTFGQKSEKRVATTLTNLRARFDAVPGAVAALSTLNPDPMAATLICHWHVQRSDPLYRAFTGWLVERRALGARAVTRDEVSAWVERFQPGRWSAVTRVEWASKLLTTARDAGLVGARTDPRPLTVPHVPDSALRYLLGLLQRLHLSHGAVLDNVYLTSVGLTGATLDERARRLPGVTLRRMGDLVELHVWPTEA